MIFWVPINFQSLAELEQLRDTFNRELYEINREMQRNLEAKQ